MRTYLLDANALIALTVAEHEHHNLAATWAAEVASVATCPVVEGALIRFLLRTGENINTATSVLQAVHASPRCAFWPDSLSYTETDLAHVRGHRQVTDAYLASLAATHGELLATLDEGLAAALPDSVELIRSRAD